MMRLHNERIAVSNDKASAARVEAARAALAKGKAQLTESERVAFIEENEPGQYLKLIASGEVDDALLEALEDYVKRQRKRLGRIDPGRTGELSSYFFFHRNFWEAGAKWP